MNLKTFHERRRQALLDLEPRRREICERCLQPRFLCFCMNLRPFDPGISFVILQHPIEMRRRVASGRMAHLALKNSHLLVGHDYSTDPEFQRLITMPGYRPLLLYPGRASVNLNHCQNEERRSLVTGPLRPMIFVIDGTWATARQTLRLSHPLGDLPRICFTPRRPSNFRLRKQPRPECMSTLEAIHETIELFQDDLPGFGSNNPGRPHDHLLELFNGMIERRLTLMTRKQRRTRAPRIRRIDGPVDKA